MTNPWSHAENALELPLLMDRIAANCETLVGIEYLQTLRPSFDQEIIAARIEATAEGVHLHNAAAIPIYSHLRDVRESAMAAEKGSVLPGTELFRTSETIDAMARLRSSLIREKDNIPILWQTAEHLPHIPRLAEQLSASINEEGQVRDNASPALQSIRQKLSTHNRRLLDKMQSLVTSLRTYLQESLFTEREGRYVLPVKAQYRTKVPGIVHDASGSGQTVFIEPEAAVAEMNKLRELHAQEREEVERILRELSAKVGEHAQSILAGIDSAAALDAKFAIAKYSRDYPQPTITNGHFIEIEEGHHPHLPREISVPLSLSVRGAHKSLLITGPNTGGKTVCLKLLGLYMLMLAMGIFPPAKAVRCGPFTGVFADIGDEQSLQQSLSTFSGHLKNIGTMFQKATSGSLALFDEIGAGTDPQEGAALAKAILTTLIERGVTVAASTHYGELKDFALHDNRFSCAAMEFDIASLKPTYRIVMGASGASHAFEISRRYGLPKDVVDRAESMLGDEAITERSKSKLLDEMLSQARTEKEQAAQTLQEAVSKHSEAERKRIEAEERLRKHREQLEETVREAIREAREAYRELLQQTASLSGKERESLLEKAKQAEAKLAASLSPKNSDQTPSIEKGMTVQIKGHPRLGKVLDISSSGNATIQIDTLKLSVKIEDLTPAEPPKQAKQKQRINNVRTTAQNITSEISLRHMRVEEAQETLDRFLDEAILAGLQKARIVHGKGEGVLRKIVRDRLKSFPEVKRFYEAPLDEGGSGVTIVEF